MIFYSWIYISMAINKDSPEDMGNSVVLPVSDEAGEIAGQASMYGGMRMN